MRFSALLDTNVLFSATLNDTVLRIADENAYQPLWSQEILGELARALVREAEVTPEAAARRVTAMRTAFPDAEVTGYEVLIDGLSCHPKDRHVLAAAIRGSAQVLVTFNVKDFRHSSLDGSDVSVISPDEFLLDQLDLHPARVGRALLRQVNEARRPTLTITHLLDRLARAGVPRFVDEASSRVEAWVSLTRE